MKTIHTLSIFALMLLLASCNSKETSITNPSDYQVYLKQATNESLKLALVERDFWKDKLQQTPNQYTYLAPLATAYDQLFAITGDISYLLEAEQLLINANAREHQKNAGLQRMQAKNYISQHRFLEALRLLENAEEIGERRLDTQKMLFDVYLELGDEEQAQLYLNKIAHDNEFDYLIRLAKWSDHKGDLDAAIQYLEKAKNIVDRNKNKNQQLWIYSNLADFYGHAGRIQESYDHYLKSLALDANFTYALKGIAWIAFSYEKNTTAANEILDYIMTKNQTPDLLQLKSDIAFYENDDAMGALYLEKYLEKVNKEAYGVMYDRPKALLYVDQKATLPKAISLAKQEIANRPTALSYDLLAWSYYKNGFYKEALKVLNEHVIDKTFEPEVQYHIAAILKANKKYEQLQPIKEDLLGSLFELGPNMKEQIQNL